MRVAPPKPPKVPHCRNKYKLKAYYNMIIMSEISQLKILKENVHHIFLLDAALPDQTLAIHGILDNLHLPEDIKQKQT